MARQPDLDAAERFVWLTARLVDRYRFAHLFRGASASRVLDALRPYQNADGGFGNGFEPDLRAPISQPVPVWNALMLLDEIGRFANPLVAAACDYLQSITTPDGGVPSVLPSARPYPRAPWWEPEDEPPAALLATAGLAALLHKHRVERPWLAPATAFCWQRIDALEETSPYEMRMVLPFLEQVPDRARAERAFARVGPKLLEQGLVALDPQATGEVHFPLDYAPRPDSLARRLFADDLIETHLDALAAAQRPDGGWTFNWLDWNPATTLEWRGWITIDALKTLRAYGRLP